MELVDKQLPEGLQEFLDQCPNAVELCNGFQLNWSKEGVGFGQFYFYTNSDTGRIHCDNEIMGREFIKGILCKMVDEAIMNEPHRKEKKDLFKVIKDDEDE